MTITLTCAFCGRQEAREYYAEFTGWYFISMPYGEISQKWVCSEECGASWLMQRVERENEALLRVALMQGAKEEP